MTLDMHARDAPKTTLQEMTVHDHWTAVFRTPENEPFYDDAFDVIADHFGPPGNSPVVDAGCGSGTKSRHLAKRGYSVLGLDISESVLKEARVTAAEAGVSAQIEFRVADLTKLPLPSASQSRMICWGVLMHVPAIEDAVAELSRVVQPGGKLIISEGNKRSLQAVSLRWVKTLLGRNRAEVNQTPAGIEFWEDTPSGKFMTRQADIPWLIREFGRHGLKLEKRRAGEFSEIYTLLPWRPLRKVVHGFNSLWFAAIRRGGPAFGNLLVFRKSA